MTRKTEPVKLKFKRNSSPRLLLEEFCLLFYMGKYLGITSFDYQEFRKYKHLKRSQGGDCYVVIHMIIVFINFNLMVGIFENTTYVEEKNLLPVLIGFVLTYFSLFAYLIDRIMGLLKQNQFIDIFETLQELEEDFDELGLTLNNRFIKYRIMLMVFSAAILEISIFVFTFTLLIDRSSWSAWLWTFTAVPTFANTIDKIWYISIIMVIKNRFGVINRELHRITVNLERKKKKNTTIFVLSTLQGLMLKVPRGSKAKVYPQKSKLSNIYETSLNKPKSMTSIESVWSDQVISSSLPFEILEERFIKLCQLHDGLCGVTKQVNDLWAIQNLVVMGYGFFIITAQLYFLYCSKVAQVIPSIFLPASNLGITALYLYYVASKCIKIVYVNWRTSLEAKKTGICLHRYGLAADKNEIYEVVNHLSLKLFNHVISFSACGYFSLDMGTLFAFCGGITTYLIILIQFNIEEQQVKSAADGKTQQSLLGNDTVLEKNITSLFSQIYYNYISGGFTKSDTN